MHISVDVRHLESGPRTGVGVATEELLGALFRTAHTNAFSVISNGWRAAPDNLSTWDALPGVRVVRGSLPNRMFDVLAVGNMLPGVKRTIENADVHLSPHMLPLPKTSTPRVLVLHDLSFVRYPELFLPRRRAWHARIRPQLQAVAAAHIVVPSGATARDAMQLWNIPQERISVIPWGTPHRLIHERQHAPDEPLILFLGTVERRKNIMGLLRAFVRIAEVHRSAKLVLAGGFGWGSDSAQEWVRTQQPHIRERIRFCGYVSEAEKAELLSLASVFVYPSFYEGSGLPVLEAMQAGVPCVVSRATALPEVCQRAALLTDPYRPEEIAAAVLSVLEDEALQRNLSERGEERARALTWNACAEQFLNVLTRVVEEAV